MVLAGDVGPGAAKVPDGLVHAPVAVFQLVGLPPRRQGGELVAQADAEQGDLSQELLNLRNLIDVFRRVPGAVGEHDPVGLHGQDGFCRRGGGEHRHLAAPLSQLLGDVALGAVVQQGHPEAGAPPLRREDGGLLPGDGFHRAGDGIGPQDEKVRRDLIANQGVHHPGLPENPGELPGVHAIEAGDAPLLQKAVQIAFASEIGGVIAPLPDHVAPDMAVPLEVLRDDAAVADEGIGLQDDLPRVAGVRQGLHIAAHAGGKDQLPHGIGLRAEPEPLEHLAVRQYQIACFHGCLPRYDCAFSSILL